MNIFKLMGTVAINRAQAVKDINVIKTSAEGASTAMGRSFTKFTGYVKAHSDQIKKAGKTLTILGGIATAAFAVSVKSAAKFEEELANVSTMLDKSAMKILPQYRDGLQDLSMEFGEATDTLSKGLYDILSASIDPAKALDVLAVAAKAATAGITDTGVAADAITTVINSYGLEAEDAAMVSDKLFAIVKRGKTTFGELAPAIGRVAATAAKSGLSFDELGATIATCTRAGVSTNETMTSVAGVLKSFLKPQTDATKLAWDEFGLVLDTNTLKTIGLTGVMDKLKDASAEQLATIFGNIRGLKGMMAALGDAEGYAKDYALMLNSAGLTQEAFEKQSDTLSFQLKQLKQTFNVVKVEVGTALIPTIKELTKTVMAIVVKVRDWMKANPELTTSIVKWAAGISVLMLVLGPLLMILPGLISSIGLIKGGVILLTTATKGLYAILGPANALILLIAGNVLIWKKNIELLTQAIRDNKIIGEMENISIDAKGKALLKLQKAYHMTGAELAEYMKTGVLSAEIRARATAKTEEGTEATDENTDATEENTEATEENAEAVEKQKDALAELLVGSKLVEAQIADINSQYELTNKTTEQTVDYYNKLIEKYKQLIVELEKEQKTYKEGTVGYQNYKEAIHGAELKIKDLTDAMVELDKVESKVLEGLELTTAQLGVLENKYSDVTKDQEYFTEKAELLRKEYQQLNEELKGTEFHSAEWFGLTNKLYDNEEAARKLEEEWEELNKVQGDALTGIELVNAELILLEARFENLAKDQDYVTKKTSLLNEKYRLLNQALAETEFHSAEWFELKKNIIAVENELGNLDTAVDDSKQRWADFFSDLKAKYSDAIGAIQTGISNFTSAFEGAIVDALTSLWHMAETNAEIQEQMAETEQEYIDAKIEMNEEYKQALIDKLAEYVDEKELANLTIAELETLLMQHSIDAYTEMSEANQAKLDELGDKYDEILGEMEGEQVTFASIMKDLWGKLVDAIITELIRLAAFYIVKWLFGLWFGEGGGVGYDLGGLVKRYDIGGRVKALEARQERAEYFAAGGPKGTDVVPAWLTPGEYVVDKPMTDFIRRTGAVTADLIRAIQIGSPTPAPAFAGGGLVGAVGASTIELNILPGAVQINTKYLDDRAISQAGPKLFAEFEKQARGVSGIFSRG